MKVKKIKKNRNKNLKGKYLASVVFIQRAVQTLNSGNSLRRVLVPDIESLAKSPFLKFKNCVKAYMIGWKTKKIFQSHEINNYKRHITELRQFYSSDCEKNKYVKKAKVDFIEAFHSALKNPNWWRNLISSKSLQEK